LPRSAKMMIDDRDVINSWSRCVQPAVAGGRAKLQSRYRRGMGRGAVTAIQKRWLSIDSA